MSEQDVDKIVGRITRKLLRTLVPVILVTVGGMFIRDHFALGNKVDVETYQRSHYELTLLVEAKIRALESLAKTNAQDISYLRENDTEFKQAIEELEEAQKELDRYIREQFRVRGYNELPEF